MYRFKLQLAISRGAADAHARRGVADTRRRAARAEAQDEAARGIIVHVMRLTQVAQRRVAATAAMLPQRRLARSGRGFRHLGQAPLVV